MTTDIHNDCPECGSPPSETSRVLVPYQPDPNDRQLEEEWAQDLPRLTALVCAECGYIVGVIDHADPEREAEGAAEFRVEEELE